MTDAFFSTMTGILFAIAYETVGFGVAKLIATVKEEQIRLFTIFLWPLVLGVYVIFGEVDFND